MKQWFLLFIKAYKDGWAVGMSELADITNPYSGFVLRVRWESGWHDGMVLKLNTWLNERKA